MTSGWEAVRFTGADVELVVPFEAMREAIWARVRDLPGNNAALMDAAVASSSPVDRQVWWQGMDTDPEFIL